jgi:hypothetical protein
MFDVYTHELGDESMEGLLLVHGIDTDNKQERNRQQALVEARACPHCSEPNKQDAKFCIACQMVLTFDEYNETRNEAEQTKKEFDELKAKMEILQANVSSYFEYSMPSIGSPRSRTKEEPLQIISWNVESGSEGLIFSGLLLFGTVIIGTFAVIFPFIWYIPYHTKGKPERYFEKTGFEDAVNEYRFSKKLFYAAVALYIPSVFIAIYIENIQPHTFCSC